MFKTAIIEQWQERFGEDDPSYAKDKIKKVEKCSDLSELLYHCMNIDMEGHHIIADKIGMSYRDFAFLLSAHRAMDQGHVYLGGEDGFSYIKKISDEGDNIIYTYTYPDGTLVQYKSVR